MKKEKNSAEKGVIMSCGVSVCQLTRIVVSKIKLTGRRTK